MNCFDFDDKQSYMDYVQSLSDENIFLQRKLICNLLDDIQTRYQNLRLYIESNVIPTLERIKKKTNTREANDVFKETLINIVNIHLNDRDSLMSLDNYSNTIRDDSNYSREESIQIIEDTYSKITTEDEKGIYDKCDNLLNLIINHSAIVLYKLYNVALLDEEKLKPYLDAPKVLFGGFNNKGEPDLKYSLKRYIYQIKFTLNFVENKF